MIVRQFLQWTRSAPVAERTDATRALARAYLHSDLSPEDRAAAEGALLMLLDDPSPVVRRALAESLAKSLTAPRDVVHALAGDQTDIARIVYAHSPLLSEGDLVDGIARDEPMLQAAIAGRDRVPKAVAAALAEVGSPEACLILLENPGALLARFSLDRIVARFGHLAAIRENLLDRDDLPVPTRQALVAKLSETLAGYVVARDWLAEHRAHQIAREACEKATVTLAAASNERELAQLIRRLRESGQLTAGLVLRALLSGNGLLFEEALAELSGMPVERVCGLIYARNGNGLRALFDKAGLPLSTYAAFREALDAMTELGFADDLASASSLKRRIVERVLTRCEQELAGEVEPLLTLLRRFAAEAARDEARALCGEFTSAEDESSAEQDELVEIVIDPRDRLIAA